MRGAHNSAQAGRPLGTRSRLSRGARAAEGHFADAWNLGVVGMYFFSYVHRSNRDADGLLRVFAYWRL